MTTTISPIDQDRAAALQDTSRVKALQEIAAGVELRAIEREYQALIEAIRTTEDDELSDALAERIGVLQWIVGADAGFAMTAWRNMAWARLQWFARTSWPRPAPIRRFAWSRRPSPKRMSLASQSGISLEAESVLTRHNPINFPLGNQGSRRCTDERASPTSPP